jgi:hypothetical protein
MPVIARFRLVEPPDPTGAGGARVCGEERETLRSDITERSLDCAERTEK